jgi:predicted N-acyltransferase
MTSALRYTTRAHDQPFQDTLGLTASAWNALLATQTDANPFVRWEYLSALADSGSAAPHTGWRAHAITLWLGEALHAACLVYVKPHSYGEYVFDFAWANAYAQHGLDYYPKAVIAVPFTPVPGPRLLARTPLARQALVQAVVDWCTTQGLSSLHLLFGNAQDLAACDAVGLMQRHTVQFHWQNTATPYADFDAFLASLNQDKRKKIRQERRKVADAGVRFTARKGAQIRPGDWDFFYRCYAQTYLEHGNAPYLTPDFFARMARTLPENWLLFVAERGGQPIASSLIAINPYPESQNVAYGRYWGALERVDCLHFEACYYQPLAWCIANGYQRFEGGAQGEHKMARALLPATTHSAHWLAHPAFATAVEKFLVREDAGISSYLQDLAQRSPLKMAPP